MMSEGMQAHAGLVVIRDFSEDRRLKLCNDLKATLIFHSRMVRSLEQVSSQVSSGLHARNGTGSSCPRNCCRI